MIELERLESHHGGFRLGEISFRVRDGECLALLGPSGAGKTLLMETMLGLHRPHSGEVRVDGVAPWSEPPERRHAAFLPQGLALFPHLSVRENVSFCLRHENEETRRRRCEELARLLRIEALLERRDLSALSGGEKQRVALARALASYPRHLYLDEPFNALDTATRRELQGELRRLQRELSLTMILVTHDLDEASALADRVLLLREGTLVQEGPTETIRQEPRDEWAARFLLWENVFRGRLRPGEKRWVCALPELELPCAPPGDGTASLPHESGFAIRARDLRLLRAGESPRGEEASFEATLTEVLPMGDGRRARLRLLRAARLEAWTLELPDELPKPSDAPCRIAYLPERLRPLPVWEGRA